MSVKMCTFILYGCFRGLFIDCRVGYSRAGQRFTALAACAVVVSLTPVAPVGYEIKPIADLLDDGPVVIHPQLKFWEWVSDYYLSSIGDVMRAALPAGLKVESETFVELARDFDASEVELSEEETIVCQMLSHHGRMMVGDLERKSGLMSSVGAGEPVDFFFINGQYALVLKHFYYSRRASRLIHQLRFRHFTPARSDELIHGQKQCFLLFSALYRQKRT